MKKIYPQQIHDPIRIKIASEVMQKELRKLLPSIPENQWVSIDKDIENWFDGSKSELASVLDFWNGFEGITQGFKLKKILPYLTAENISWTKKKIPINDIIFTTNLPVLSFLAEAPFKISLLIDIIRGKKNQIKINEIKLDSDKHAKSSIPRDNYPIIVLQGDDGYKVLDGHRRVIRKILMGEDDIEGYVGKYATKEHYPRNFWISTGFLRSLVRIRDFHPGDHKSQEAIGHIIEHLKRNHQNVEYILPLRVLNKKDRIL